jgi:hypothetical protein
MRRRIARKVYVGVAFRRRKYRPATVLRALKALGVPVSKPLPASSAAVVCVLIRYWPEVEAFALEGENVLSI